MPGETVKVFVCYSHSDRRWVANGSLIPWLQKNLARYRVEFWWDREERDGIQGGDTWRKKIMAEIDRADIAILLISDDFASSDFIRDFEVPRIRERHTTGTLSILPVLASPISELGREELAWVYDLQIVPSKQLPLIKCQEPEAQWHDTRAKLLDELNKRVQLHRLPILASTVSSKPVGVPVKAASPAVPRPPKSPAVPAETRRAVDDDHEMTERKVKQIIADQLNQNVSAVRIGASFVNDLKANSLDIVEIVMAFEEAFGLEIPDEDAEKIVTVGEAIRYIERNKA